MQHIHIFKTAAFCLCLAMGQAQAATLVVDVSANAANAAGLQKTVDDFREALGDNNGNAPVNGDPNGRRQINWDAAPDGISDPNPFPGDFFNGDANPRARGIEFRESGDTTGFLLSATEASGQPTGFGFDDFLPFSPERLFSPIGGNTFDVLFFDPSDQVTPALSRGLGVVFSDVEEAGLTTMTLFDQYDNVLATREAEAGEDRSLSFLGVIFDDAVIAKASFSLGDGVLRGNRDRSGKDVVVMDDFIFGEPIGVSAVPLPAGLPILLTGLGALAGLRMRRRALSRK